MISLFLLSAAVLGLLAPLLINLGLEEIAAAICTR